MAPGVITLDGFIGDDNRSLDEIIEADRATLSQLGVTPEVVGTHLERLTIAALSTLGTTSEVEGFELRATEAMGKSPCPFMHPGLFPKATIYGESMSCGITLCWTVLTAHLIKEHGFFQGIGSPYRIEPGELVEFLSGKN